MKTENSGFIVVWLKGQYFGLLAWPISYATVGMQ